MSAWAKRVNSMVLFFEDVPEAAEFYHRVFDVPVEQVFEDCYACTIGDQLTVLVGTGLYGDNIAPAKVAPRDAGVRGWNSFFVDDVDQTAAMLVERGVTLLREPEDRPEGHRAAMFADPGGHVYEISSGPSD